jgi:uncharacterized LabA/DUF88 family protein
MSGKIYVFIDSQNLNLGVQSQGWKLDFNRFYFYLKEKYKVNTVLLFIGFIPRNKALYNSLEKIGYRLIFKPVVRPEKHNNKIKGNIDAELVLHSMIEFPNYDKAIIVSGDGDFYCLIDYLFKKNKLYRIIAPNKKYSSLLRKFSSFILNISFLRNKLEYKKR